MSCDEPSGCHTEAQRFFLAVKDWLVRRARRALRRWNLPDVAEDVVHDAFIKCGHITDDKWRQILHPKSYLGTMIDRMVMDLFEKYRPDKYQPLSECKASTSTEAMEGALLVKELFEYSSPAEQKLLKLVYGEECSWNEIAEELEILSPAARKRFSRLVKKLKVLTQEATTSTNDPEIDASSAILKAF